jgi:N6-adenosine-specific RNA methylase IME4
MNPLAKYDAACRALAEAVTADEVMQLRLEAKTLEYLARVAENIDMEIKARTLRVKAELKLGLMLLESEEKGTAAAHGGNRKSQDSDPETCSRATLKEMGIGPKLSAQSRKLAAIGVDGVDDLLGEFKKTSENRGALAVDIITAATAKRNAQSRRNLAQELSDATALQPTGRKFPVIYADPAWRRKAGIGNRAYENHYTTETWEEILAMPVANRTLPDAWLFLWIPRAHLLALHPTTILTDLGPCKIKLPLAYAVAQAWGFDAYSTCFIWTKTDEECPEDHGLGLIVWDQDEVLCLFKRGRGLPKPDTDVKVGSNHRERATDHSSKPTYYRDMINAMTGNLPVLELFASEDENNWLPPNFYTWGNQSLNTAERIADDSGTNQDSETRTNHQPNGTDARPPAKATVSEPASADRQPLIATVDAGSPSFSESDLPEIILPGKWATFEHVAGFVDLTSEVAGRAS